MDSGCTDHITPSKSDFAQYKELPQAAKTEIVDGKFLTIEGLGTVIGKSIMADRSVDIQIRNLLYVSQANKWLFALIATGQYGSASLTMKRGTTISQNGIPYIIGMPKSGKLHSFDLLLTKAKGEQQWAQITTLSSDYTLWHRRMGHVHQHIIKHLGKNTEGGPHQPTSPPPEACEGCEKGKSR